MSAYCNSRWLSIATRSDRYTKHSGLSIYEASMTGTSVLRSLAALPTSDRSWPKPDCTSNSLSRRIGNVFAAFWVDPSVGNAALAIQRRVSHRSGGFLLLR